MATVKMGLRGLSSAEIAVKAQGIHDSIVGNAKLPTPAPTAAVVQTHIDTLVQANADAEKNGGKAEHQAKRMAEAQVLADLKAWSAYVQNASGGDANTILSSSFGVVKRGSALPEPAPPKKLFVRVTNKTGRCSFRWDREVGADMHHVFLSLSNDPFKWELIGATTKSRFDADSLEPGTFYWFAVTAIGAAGESSKSEPLIVMAAA